MTTLSTMLTMATMFTGIKESQVTDRVIQQDTRLLWSPNAILTAIIYLRFTMILLILNGKVAVI
jgi:hypothetical protein